MVSAAWDDQSVTLVTVASSVDPADLDPAVPRHIRAGQHQETSGDAAHVRQDVSQAMDHRLARSASATVSDTSTTPKPSVNATKYRDARRQAATEHTADGREEDRKFAAERRDCIRDSEDRHRREPSRAAAPIERGTRTFSSKPASSAMPRTTSALPITSEIHGATW